MKTVFLMILVLGFSTILHAQTAVETGGSSLENNGEPQLGSDLEGRDPGVPMDQVPQEEQEEDAGVRGGTGMGEGAATGLSGGVGTGSGESP